MHHQILTVIKRNPRKTLAYCTIFLTVMPNKPKNSIGTLFATLFLRYTIFPIRCCPRPHHATWYYTMPHNHTSILQTSYHTVSFRDTPPAHIHQTTRSPCKTIPTYDTVYRTTMYYNTHHTTSHHTSCPPFVAPCACKFMSSLAHILFHPRHHPCFKHGPSEIDSAPKSGRPLSSH